MTNDKEQDQKRIEKLKKLSWIYFISSLVVVFILLFLICLISTKTYCILIGKAESDDFFFGQISAWTFMIGYGILRTVYDKIRS